MRSARCLGLGERIGALVKKLKVLAGGVSAGGGLGNIRVLILSGDLDLEVGGLLGKEAAGSDVEQEDGCAEDCGILDGRLGKLVGLSHVSLAISTEL